MKRSGRYAAPHSAHVDGVTSKPRVQQPLTKNDSSSGARVELVHAFSTLRDGHRYAELIASSGRIGIPKPHIEAFTA
ncbi:hypothetical protein [Burkholderia alba]|uniref:hypothetical protein n=1 Tax=Burkholderia alba TaxID=2683677 RepID=UPI002B05F390|nr:hypothetical protein [Burkholderia alba]